MLVQANIYTLLITLSFPTFPQDPVGKEG